MPVDMFPAMNIPVVVVATFYSGMPVSQASEPTMAAVSRPVV
jgi:multidrug efflux pump subunit AcrB